MKRILTKKFWLRGTAVVVVLLGLYWALLSFPQPFFHFSVRAHNLTLYSDQPFSTEEGKQVLEMAEAKLETSPLYSTGQSHAAYICNARWRQRLFFNRKYGAGGLNQYPITSNVFLREAVIDENRLLSPSGTQVPGDRTLDYYIAHEITHTLTVQAVGWFRFYKLPEWIREGYADYVGKGASFHYEEARRAFLDNAPEMDRQKSGLYLRYHLLVAFMLEKKHWGVQQLLENPPEQRVVEDEVRNENTSASQF